MSLSTPQRGPRCIEPGVTTVTLSLEVGDIIVGVFLAAVAAWFFREASAMPDFSGTAIGAADFPQGLAVLLGVASLGLAGGAAWRLVCGRRGRQATLRRPLRVLLGMALLAAFPMMMDVAGYYIAMTIFLASFLYLADCRDPISIILYVAGFLLFTKLVFEMLLKTPLP